MLDLVISNVTEYKAFVSLGPYPTQATATYPSHPTPQHKRVPLPLLARDFICADG